MFSLTRLAMSVGLISSAMTLAIGKAQEPSPSQTTSEPARTVTVDLATEVGPAYNFWNVYPITDQSAFLDEANFNELKRKYRYAKYINCVRLLGGIDDTKDTYIRGFTDDGEIQCDFSEAIAILSGIRQCGFIPWIVLDNVPAELSSEPTENRYGNTQPPKDFDLWRNYIRQFMNALIAAFGREEVASWRFRVGTEPDLNPGHWTGTLDQWLEHYDHTVAAVRAVLPEAEIGPGNVVAPLEQRRHRSWADDIIRHCATGTNHVSGETGTPLDFFATSYYTSVGKPDRKFDDVVKHLRRELRAHQTFQGVALEVHEFGILSEGGNRIIGDGTQFGGSWMAHMADKAYRLDVRRIYQWDWNTNKGGDIPTPITHVMDMLEQMEAGTRMEVSVSGSNEKDRVGCIASIKDEQILLMLFRHRADRDDGASVPVRLTVRGLTDERKDLQVERAHLTNGQHAGFISQRDDDVRRMRRRYEGQPNAYRKASQRVMSVHRESYEKMSQLHSIEPPPEFTRRSKGHATLETMLDGHSVLFLRLR